MLLYKSERQQYQEAIADHVSPSTVYGAEHLLRLFGMLLFYVQKVTLIEKSLSFSLFALQKYCYIFWTTGCCPFALCVCLHLCVCMCRVVLILVVSLFDF